MDEMSEVCENCGHAFKLHQQATFGLWYCDFEDSCPCNNYVPVRVLISDDDSYMWN